MVMPHGRVGRRAVQLLVEEVAPSSDGLCEERTGHHDVERQPQRHLVAPTVPGDAHDRARDATVQTEPAVGREHDGREVVAVVQPLVDDVVQPGADERTDRDRDEGARDERGVEPSPAAPHPGSPTASRRWPGRSRGHRTRRAAARSRWPTAGRSRSGRTARAERATEPRDRHILRPMNDGYAWWLLLVGLAVGLSLMWLALVRLPRDEDDIDLDGAGPRGGLDQRHHREPRWHLPPAARGRGPGSPPRVPRLIRRRLRLPAASGPARRGVRRPVASRSRGCLRRCPTGRAPIRACPAGRRSGRR